MQIPATYAFPTVGNNQNKPPPLEGSAPADRSGKSATAADQINQARTPGAETAQEPQAVSSLQSAQGADPASIFAALADDQAGTDTKTAEASNRPPPPPPPPADENAANTNAATSAYGEVASLFDQSGSSTALQLLQQAS